MLWLGALLFFSSTFVAAVDPKEFSAAGALLESRKSKKAPTPKKYNTPPPPPPKPTYTTPKPTYPTPKPYSPSSSGSTNNGYPKLDKKNKAYLEQCIIDPFIQQQLNCGNNPYAGLCRLAFHDCGTFDATASTNRGGCNAWMTKKCKKIDQCEYMAPENNGLAMWVDPLDKMYDSAKLGSQDVDKMISRADFWHLASFYAVRKSSGGKLKMDYYAGRVDPDVTSPRFKGRLPDAFAWSEMQRVAKRNGMDDLSAAALLGAHTLGQAHPTTSGYQGAWDPTPFVFDELFFDGLLDLKWFVHNIDSVNSLTGEKTSKTQFSLGGENFDRSLMLFSDMGMHVNLDKCDWDDNDVANGKCPINNKPSGLQGAIRTWADQPSTFFSAFANAWEAMSKWGCTGCYEVGENTDKIVCPSTYKPDTCKANYKEGNAKWTPSYKNPVPPPTTKPGGYSKPTPTPKPTTTYKPTPTPITYRPTPTPTTYRPTPTPTTPTTYPPTTPTTYPPTTPTTYPPTTPTTYPPTTPTTYPPTTPTTYPPTTPTTYPPTPTPTNTGTITKSPPDTTTTTPPPQTTPPETTTCAPTTTSPPETTTSPPETTTYPPETTTSPPETTTYPPTTTTTYPPTTTTYPPTTTTRPPYYPSPTPTYPSDTPSPPPYYPSPTPTPPPYYPPYYPPIQTPYGSSTRPPRK